MADRGEGLTCPPVSRLSADADARRERWSGAGSRGHIKERLSQWVLVSSRPLHLACWDVIYTHMHTQISEHDQMSFNGSNNVPYSLTVHLCGVVSDKLFMVKINLTELNSVGANNLMGVNVVIVYFQIIVD